MNKGLKRLKGVVVSRPFIYGNVAVELNPPKQDHTHEWTVFVKSCDGSDLSHIIPKVEIKLHETFVSSNRVLTSLPYEVTETGWGEFEVIIKLFFPPCSGENPISLYHMLKLYPPEGQASNWPKHKQVNNVYFDELIFSEPTEEFFEILMANKSPGLPATIGVDHPFSLELELKEAKILDEAIEKTKAQYKEYELQLAAMKKEILSLKSEGFYF
ncbi:Protein AF-9-like protein [Smittium mucronatum]|uniref:Protein AF-9 homolog n=1 Tax=Smittium mucronatum TaxID=133383 RepID=A0A1R0H2X2_9FUNG|nr:Protein AF-9-like protein [Smittium mucronatum]